MDISHILTHLGEERENYYGAVSPPIFQTSIFCFKDVATMREGLQREFETPFYTRGYNPTVAVLRKKLAALESAEDALAFASGSAAIAAAVMSVVKAGDHAICVEKPYSWTNKLFNDLLIHYGVESDMVDGTKVENFSKAIKPNTKLIYLESPNWMTFEMQDIEAVCRLAKEKGIVTIVDNSYSSPINQRPVELGADMVVHSASKYLGGHSDIVAGILCGSKERIDRIFESELMTLGGIISPHDAWLMIRGLRTLKLRMDRVSSSGEKVAEFLENHPKVEKVFYPFSKSNPQYELAKKQMSACAGMCSVLMKVEKMEQVEKFVNGLQRFLIACSWGGHESLVFPACALYDSQNYDNPGLPWNLVRFYIGLEEPEALIEDIEQALNKP